ncbi:hypothetical protein E2C01_055912 [Portunus trituberculatus]|uniref:Uncharacterized protein n=1 Tax=Portunus trituberculatus TaxID=210409 RepID=A0A5B7GYX6_PORTR|nr:hypothetical protein [Portunus trituberculatus]
MSSSDHWTQDEDIPLLSYYFPEIMVLPQAALKIVGTEQFFHMSIEVAMPRMSWARTLSSRQEESGKEAWADLMVSHRKKEIAALDIGLEGHLTARKRLRGLVGEAVLCRTHDGGKALNTKLLRSTMGVLIHLSNKFRKIRGQQILSLPARLRSLCAVARASRKRYFLVRSLVDESRRGLKAALVRKRRTTSKFQEGRRFLLSFCGWEEQALIISLSTWSLLRSNPLIARTLLSMAL